MKRSLRSPHGGPAPKLPKAPNFMAADRRAKDWDKEAQRPIRIVGIAAIVLLLGVAGFLVYLSQMQMRPTPAHVMEAKQVGDVAWHMDTIVQWMPPSGRKQEEIYEAKGARLWMLAFRHKLVDSDYLGRHVSLGSNDTRAESDFLTDASIPLPVENCSYTAPSGADLARLRGLKGDSRCVLITFNSRNWNNYPEHGAVVIWSDETKGEWLTFEEARDEWGITAEEWADPAGKLFGKKAPFQHTYE